MSKASPHLVQRRPKYYDHIKHRIIRFWHTAPDAGTPGDSHLPEHTQAEPNTYGFNRYEQP